MGYAQTFKNRKPTFKSDLMNKLTTEQIRQIEEKLYTDYEFYYDDAKHEVIDHIASEIEEEMKNNSYEASFGNVFQNWHDRLQETEWSGMHWYGKIKMPLFYKSQLMSTFRNDLFLWIGLSFLFPIIIYLFKDLMEIETINSTVFIYKIIVFIIAIILNKYTLEKYKNGEYTTVYGQIASWNNNKIIGAISLVAVSLILLQRDNFRHKENIELGLATLIFFNAFYFMFIIKFCNYFRHLKLVKKIKIWKHV